MEALAGRHEAVATREFGFGNAVGQGHTSREGVDVEAEFESAGIVANHMDGPGGDIACGNGRVEIDERRAGLHCVSDPAVVVMVWVRAEVFIDHGSVGLESVIVGAGPAAFRGDGGEGEGAVVKDRGLEDALRADEVDLLAAEAESSDHSDLVLSAFSCGVFRIRPRSVARRSREVLGEGELDDVFHRVVFAIFDEHNVFLPTNWEGIFKLVKEEFTVSVG